ncbi:sugar (and other) transporter family protein [Candidatus Neoehrlichia lotoris str. RAC413]|uniref:Sugar (And other) transporter family protein n=1 Tax=Candidatus Neoehrlichia procyonis str. RAC413 TaxID=1359163 RepID=A0A0F3NME6_9RICK|nr:sugar (and other) transporter family protein [Candidatus Neoehrlichia lotoris str. RAC413]
MLVGNLANIISNLFFPLKDKYWSFILTFSVFAIGFVARPFGAAIFGHIGDKYGRKTALTISIISMSISIAYMMVIPVYSSIGIYAPVLLIICRLIQGVSLGGEAGNAAFLIEHSNNGKNNGLLGSYEVLSAVIGSLMATLVIIITHYFTDDNFLVWGWRIPFLIGLLMGIVSVYIRCRNSESPAYYIYKEKNTLVRFPVVALFKNYKRPLLLAICIDCVENCSFHIFMVFFVNFVNELSSTHVDLQLNFMNVIAGIGISVCGVLTVFFGAISDFIGKRKIMMIASIGLFCVSIPVFWTLNQGSYIYIVIGYILFTVPFAATLGPSSAAMSELFPTNVRYTGFGLARNISSAIAGGMAPLVCTWLIRITDIKIAPALYVMFWAVISYVALSVIKERDIYIDW